MVTAPPDLDGLLEHLDECVTPHHTVERVARTLLSAGFVEMHDVSADPVSRGFLRRDGLIIAWTQPENGVKSFRLLGAHTDSPCLKVKPRPDSGTLGWRQIGVEIYGGILNNSWLDRDLGIAGRIVLADGTSRLFRSSSPVARIPQLAVHLDREVNERGLVLDRQAHLLPVSGTGSGRGFVDWLADEIAIESGDVASWDLSLFDTARATVIGFDSDLLVSGRIDNQVSCWASIGALLDSQSAATSVVALFDHEEVGSESVTGASGPWLERVLRMLAVRLDDPSDPTSFDRLLSRSECLSADCAHAVHPNYAERHDPAHRPLPNVGPVLKVNANQRYATSDLTAARFGAACRAAGVEQQIFSSKNSVPCGSTIGPLAATRLGIPTADVGAPQLSMHSAREMCGIRDPHLLRRALSAFLALPAR